MIDERILEVRHYTGEGFQPQIYFGTWRVAILNFIESMHPARIEQVERHIETDEVFVLTHGKGILFLGEGETNFEKMHTQVMEPGVIYNVKLLTWHTAVLSRDASVLIVENGNTGEDNTKYWSLNPEQRKFVLEISRKEQPGLWD